MRIGIIGTGNVGGTLGTRWAQAGHDIIFGTRAPDSPKVRSLIKLTEGKARAAGHDEAVASCDIVVLATPWPVVEEVLKTAGNLAGKTVVDCTNPIGEGPSLAVGHNTSAAEQVSLWARGARVVKAFNTTGANNMADPAYGSDRVTMFICGDDVDAKKTVTKLASDLGFDVCDAGKLRVARYLEPLAMLWIHLSHTQGMGREIAFKLINR